MSGTATSIQPLLILKCHASPPQQPNGSRLIYSMPAKSPLYAMHGPSNIATSHTNNWTHENKPNVLKPNKTKTHDQIDWVGLYKISKMPNIPTFLRKFESTCQPQVIYTKGKKRLCKNTLSVHREKNCPPYQSDSKKIFLSNKFLENLI